MNPNNQRKSLKRTFNSSNLHESAQQDAKRIEVQMYELFSTIKLNELPNNSSNNSSPDT